MRVENKQENFIVYSSQDSRSSSEVAHHIYKIYTNTVS